MLVLAVPMLSFVSYAITVRIVAAAVVGVVVGEGDQQVFFKNRMRERVCVR